MTMTLTQVTTGGVDESINIDGNTLKVDGTNNRVGIGQSSPASKLHLSGTSAARFQLTTDSTGHTTNDGVRIQIDSSNNLELLQRESANIEFFTASAERMRIDSSGNVGVNNSSPSSYDSSARNLVVGSGSGNQGITIAAGTSSSSAINFADGTSGTAAYTGRILYQHSANALTFHTNGGGERLRITSAGLIDVSGGIHVTENITPTSGSGVEIFKATSTAGQVQAYNRDSSAPLDLILKGNNLQFFANSSERLRIDSSGRLLVGTSTSTYNATNQTKLGVVITGDTSRGGVDITGYTGGSSTGRGPELSFKRSIGTTDGSVTALSAAPWTLGVINFSGSTGSNFSLGAEIRAVSASQTYTSSSSGGELRFSTVANNSTSPTERMRINNAGAVTKPSNPLLKSNISYNYGSSGSLITSPGTAILQASAEIDKGSNGWTTSGSNAYTFVCPVDGIYVVHAHTSLGSITTGRLIWVMGYTLGGGNLPLANYVEVMDTQASSHENYSYFNTWSFTAGTRVGFGMNGANGANANHSAQWGIYLLQ